MLVAGSTFGGGQGTSTVGLLDRDGSEASAGLAGVSRTPAACRSGPTTTLDDLRLDVRTSVVNAGLVIPPAYGDDMDAGPDRPRRGARRPRLDHAAAVGATVQGAVGDESVRLAAGRFTATHTDGLLPDSLAMVDRVAPTQPPVEVATVPVAGDRSEGGAFDYAVPANLVLFVFVSTITLGAALAGDRRLGLVRRMLATPHRPGTILAGIGGAKLAFSILQSSCWPAWGPCCSASLGVDPWGRSCSSCCGRWWRRRSGCSWARS